MADGLPDEAVAAGAALVRADFGAPVVIVFFLSLAEMDQYPDPGARS